MLVEVNEKTDYDRSIALGGRCMMCCGSLWYLMFDLCPSTTPNATLLLLLRYYY